MAAITAAQAISVAGSLATSSAQKATSNVAAVKVAFVGGKALRQGKTVAAVSQRSAVISAESVERPLWFPGSSSPERLDGSLPATLEAPDSTVAPAITLTEKALNHLSKMRNESSKDLLLRLGVRQGGCSGFSYVMDFEERTNVQEGDSIIEYEGFAMVCDPKSLLFLYGMQLDYSDALIGGGFSFTNPNASATCGCGKSFAA